MTAPSFTFVKATKKEAKARIALDGISGSGKTFTALTIASALGQRIAVIDTEHRSASKYAGIFNFDTLALDSYDPRILIGALAAAGDAAYEVAVVDSMSHFWMGSGGMLEAVDHAAKRAGGHGMSGWKEMRPVERQMIEALLAFPGHVIVTLRVKNDWVEQEVRGRKAMVKVGTKAEQREGLEYEFDIVGSLSSDNELIISKSRCPQLSGAVIAKPTLDLGHTIREWLEDGESGAPTVADFRTRAVAQGVTRAELIALHGEVRAAGLLAAPVLDSAGIAVSLGELIVQLGRQMTAPPPAEQTEAAPAAEPAASAEQAPTTPAAEPRPDPTANGVRDWTLLPDRTADGIRTAAARLVRDHPAVAATFVINEHGDDEQLHLLMNRRAQELTPNGDRQAREDQATDAEQEDRRRKRMHALWGDLGYTGAANRAQRLVITSKIVAREIGSTNDLVWPGEVEQVIAALEDRQRRENQVAA